MADDDKDSKTEKPTDKHLRESFEKGNFAKSPELQVVATLAAALWALSLTLSSSVRDVAALSANIWGELATSRLRTGVMPIELQECAKVIAQVLAPILGAVVVATLLIGGFQSGFRLTPKTLGIKLEALDISAGFGRLFSKDKLIHGAVDLLKLITIATVLWMGTRSLVNDPIFMSPVEVIYLGEFLHRVTVHFMGKMLFAIGVIAAISYGYEKFKNTRDMMMSREEIKEEHKQAEGDARTKGAMRRMARRFAQKQMLDAVPTADVVVTNPTHYAVALKYERGRDSAPKVLAKGENRFALRIKGMAAEHGVPVVENRPVARMLFAMGKVDESIPSELYQAVAEILALVYRTHRLYFHDLKMRRAAAEGAARRAAAAQADEDSGAAEAAAG